MRMKSSHLLGMALLVGCLFGWSSGAPAQAKKGTSTSSIMEVYKDKGGKYRFRMRDAEGNLLCNSGKGFKTKAECIKVVSEIQKVASKAKTVEEGKKVTGAHFELYKDKGGKYRFRLRNADGTRLASSGKGHKTTALCMSAVATIQQTASMAKVVEAK